jgi:hypothetical protein
VGIGNGTPKDYDVTEEMCRGNITFVNGLLQFCGTGRSGSWSMVCGYVQLYSRWTNKTGTKMTIIEVKIYKFASFNYGFITNRLTLV